MLIPIFRRKTATAQLGSEGEKIGEAFLKKLGYEIRGRNIRLGRDEIDLLAFDPTDKVLVFAEVKTRKTNHPDYRPALNVDHRKRKALQRAARRWIADHEYEDGYRIDLLCIAEGRVIDHVKELAWD